MIIFGVLAFVGLAACGSHAPLHGPDGGRDAGSAGQTGRTDAKPPADAAPLTDAPVTEAPALTDAAPLTDATLNPATLPDGRCIQGAYARDGACMCQVSTPAPCGERCANLELEDGNCGACGHACGLTSTCNQGVCTPAPVEILAAQPGCMSLDLASSAGALVWADAGHGTITRLGPGEAAPTVMASGETGAAMIAARGDAVFWVAGDKKLLRMGRPGAAPVTVTASATEIHGLTVSEDAAAVYFSTENRVMRVSAAGGAPVEVARDENNGRPVALALDGDRLAYPTDLTGHIDVITLVEGQVASCSKIEGDQIVNFNCVNVSRGGPPKLLERIVLLPGRVLWASDDSVYAGATTGDPRTVHPVAGTEGNVLGLAATADFVYLSGTTGVGLDPSSEIYKAAITATAQGTLRLARNQNRARALVVDDARVTWSTGDCRIMATGL